MKVLDFISDTEVSLILFLIRNTYLTYFIVFSQESKSTVILFHFLFMYVCQAQVIYIYISMFKCSTYVNTLYQILTSYIIQYRLTLA